MSTMKVAYGSLDNLATAISAGTIDAGDIVFLTNGQLAFMIDDTTPMYIKGEFTTPIIIDEDNAFPSTAYQSGEKYIIAVAGEYFGVNCEIGDLILIINDYDEETASNDDAIVLQGKLQNIVTGIDSSTDGDLIMFNGTDGTTITTSSINVTELSEAIEKAHEHTNLEYLETYTMSQDDLLASASSTAQSLIDEAIGEIPDGYDVKTYIDASVGSGGTDVTDTIAAAITTAEEYTDDAITSALTIVEF